MIDVAIAVRRLLNGYVFNAAFFIHPLHRTALDY